ncbi:MAG: OadG family protein [Sulfurovum sp.]|uniref:OadG family protein n=1 Tax=Sulfurovum sp. TaxID=1969726 RepID=UPI0028680026|nr:OadG family protein [Sulfurovum sp.]MCO4845010.1 OadG family protein [Sulfurovum sp.]
MEINLIGESLKFMVLGMMVVFVFLAILVQIMKLQAKIINKYFPEKAPEVASTSKNVTQEAHHVSAIIAAVTEFRKK